eukprot:CAMPEP_0171454108 /NCGR_PEP_ID=MMETSP0945-20130129/1532_1 /TAXON_ID=109269 /ORGANISM="Vaucheria litorea, Strain CCMP2940" /LENGTH=473 /DNA_ID=CAMNT_0011979077 /DNA_START=299 /DNA_END=1720 /DNA_ORIENTATION=+
MKSENFNTKNIRSISPKVLRKLFEKLGATYIKLGQFIASSPTLFPSEYVLEFQKCLDKTDYIPWNEAMKIIETELQRPIETVFSNVNSIPIASASIAQVYEATLKNGDSVVIKVQKPNVADILKTDLSFLLIVSKVVEYLNPEFSRRLSLSNIVSDIRRSMLEEVDFTLEADNLKVFAEFLTNEYLDDEVTCPKVYADLSTKKVLTMEKLEGVALTDLDSIRNYSDDPEKTLISALNAWTRSIMAAPFFHADVHSGNLLVLKDGRVGFIDFGIVGRFSSETWSGVSSLADSLVERDFEGVAKAMVEMGATFGPVDIENFGRDVESLYTKFERMDPNNVSEENNASDTTGLLLDLVSLSEKNNLRLPREFGLIVKQQLYFDRYTRILAPTLDPLRDSRIGLQRKAKIDLFEDNDDQTELEKMAEKLKDVDLMPPEGYEGEWPPKEWGGPRPPKNFKFTRENVKLLKKMIASQEK